MLVGKKKTPSSFGPNGKRLSTPGPILVPGPKLGGGSAPSSCTMSTGSSSCRSSSRMFAPGVTLVVQRAPVMCGLSVPLGLQKKFQRPMTGRRSYDRNAEAALKNACLGQRRRMDGMSKLMARAGRGLSFKLPSRPSDQDEDELDQEEEDDKENKEAERPFEPLEVWKSPHEGGECIGLPPKMTTEMQADEYGVEESVTVLRPAPASAYTKKSTFVPPVLAKWLRPHQREGVQFMYECVMGLRSFQGNGCILADDMGLGKTLQSVALIYTLLKTGITLNGAPTAKRIIVVCPCSLVKNWDNEFTKWLGPGVVKTLALAESDRKSVEKNMDVFVKTKMFNILICSYECIRAHVGRLNKYKDCCDLLVCDEAHRLKNADNQTSKALNSLPVERRVLLTGTPMQNDLQEFFAMVDFTNPGVLGTQEDFRRKFMFPVLRGREPDATESQKRKMVQTQQNMSNAVNDFILRRINTLNAQHLPPKLVQVVSCNLTEIQQNMYQHLVTSKDLQHVLDGKQVNCLSSIQMLMKLCNHPRLVAEEDSTAKQSGGGRRAASKKISYCDEEKSSAAPGADGVSKFLPYEAGGGGRGGMNTPVRPEWSGKMFVLYRLMREMRKPGNGNDKIVIISNYTQTLDLIGKMCRENCWGFCRLDGSISMKKRQGMVEDFNDPGSSLVAFLLSSKAGGCGLNLIGGNRLVLFDPDWNPAVDKQAAARCWRDGQKKRCFTYRFLATGTVEEKIFQRQLSKEGLQSVVDDKEQVNTLSTKDLRNLFKLRQDTPSDTHDKLRCDRCKIIADNAEMEAIKVLPKQLTACRDLLDRMMKEEDAAVFITPIKPEEHGVSSTDYDKLVRQPIDFGTIRNKIDTPVGSNNAGYKSTAAFSKDVNRVFANVLKVWSPGQEIADAARRLQSWWVDEWTMLVPVLMSMKSENDHCGAQIENIDDKENENLQPTVALVNNERGEDYQEQIGMPDEENMRSWSHHYSTDTCDDPIFRAAMRGYDNVSFVFGLEVTWSLIQQRQQDEEEREAMLELERIQKVEEEEAAAAPSFEIIEEKKQEDNAEREHVSDDNKEETQEDTDSRGGTNKSEIGSTTKISSADDIERLEESPDDDSDDDEEWILSRIFSIEELKSSSPPKCEVDGCSRIACAIWKSNKEEKWKTCLDCQEEDYGGWPDGMNPKDDGLSSFIAVHCSGEGVDDKNCSSSPNESQVRNINISTTYQEPSPMKHSASSVSSTVTNSPPSSGSEWNCTNCTLANRATARKCKMCGGRRGQKNTDTVGNASTDMAIPIGGIEVLTPEELIPSNEHPSSASSTGSSPSPSCGDEWNCVQCTFANRASARKCSMCNKKKPSKKRSIDEVA